MTEKKPRKQYPRPTTVRFTTDEAKLIYMAMNYAAGRDLFTNEGMPAVRSAGIIIGKLKFRIDEERKKKDKIMMSIAEVKSEELG